MESGEERREGGRKTLEDWRDARPDRLACSPTPTVPACTVVPCSGLSSYRFVCFASRSGFASAYVPSVKAAFVTGI